MKKVLGVGIILIMLLGACGQRGAEPAEEDQEDRQTDQIEDISREPEEEPEEEVVELGDTEDIENDESEEQEESIDDTSQSMTEDELREIIEYTGIGEGDELVSATIENEEIKAVINLGEFELFTIEDLAVTRYSQLSDELLDHEGWEKLTIEFSDIGTITMDRSDAESNEYGEYFPTLEIEDRLK
ncbi:cobalamin biosynthesis protein CobT [Virgibacillus halotolerans]|uniref:hypothetical protein n=1 Tax=Virgibacillus halotolerans TaxID=1071053 RepID=UPI00195F7D66|nr:hypothetical protein [Virgibacillus halotolerans]MBM7598485.1 cobalamin biosynthesis protein CobT [Virgibacillus halotolerans]